METLDLISLIAGILLTWGGAEMLVRGSSNLALRFGVPPFVVGLTVVALGTSAPEAVVSFTAAIQGTAGIALGNVLGSNIANIGLILGVVALLSPVRCRWKRVRKDYALMLLASLVVAGSLVFLHGIPRPMGIGLLLGQIVLVGWYVRSSRKKDDSGSKEIPEAANGGMLRPLLSSVVGLLVLMLGARFLVLGAVAIAEGFGVPEEIIGVTIVAVGTSLPELAASVVASLRGHHDLGLGNILGSNVMNLLFVLGGAALIRPIPATENVEVLFVPAFLLFSLLLWPMLATRDEVNRWEGGVLLVLYLGFCTMAY